MFNVLKLKTADRTLKKSKLLPPIWCYPPAQLLPTEWAFFVATDSQVYKMIPVRTGVITFTRAVQRHVQFNISVQLQLYKHEKETGQQLKFRFHSDSDTLQPIPCLGTNELTIIDEYYILGLDWTWSSISSEFQSVIPRIQNSSIELLCM